MQFSLTSFYCQLSWQWSLPLHSWCSVLILQDFALKSWEQSSTTIAIQKVTMIYVLSKHTKKSTITWSSANAPWLAVFQAQSAQTLHQEVKQSTSEVKTGKSYMSLLAILGKYITEAACLAFSLCICLRFPVSFPWYIGRIKTLICFNSFLLSLQH